MPESLKGFGEPLIALPEVDSTNNYAMARIAEGPVKEGTTWFAWKQTAGKGQRGRPWQSQPGENVLISAVLRPFRLLPSQQFMLSAAVALGVSDLVSRYADGEVKIKWSNDVYIGDKKAGGILIENVIRGSEWSYAVVGIGLNINQEIFPPDLPNPVSLHQVTGEKYDVLAVARALCACLSRRYDQLHRENHGKLLEEYTASLYGLNRELTFMRAGETFKGTIEGVEKDGRLRLRKGRSLLILNFGDLSFVL